MSRRRAACGQAPSKGYLRARRQAGKLHEKAASQNRHGARIWAKDVVDNHHIIAVEDFTPLFGATSTMAGDSADGAINAPTAELIDRGTRAGTPVVRVVPANHDVFEVLAETSTPAAREANLAVCPLRVHRSARPQRRRSDSGHR
jgi:hypothetical protein